MKLDVKFNPSQLADLQRELRDIPNAVPRVLNGAINKTLPTARTRSTRRIVDASGLKTTDVRNAIKIVRSTMGTLTGHLVIKAKTFPLTALQARQTAAGVTYKQPDGSRGFVKSAFLATMKTGHTGVFLRAGRARLPIHELKSSPLTDVYNSDAVLTDEMNQIGDVLQKNVDSQVDRLLAKQAIDNG